MNKSQPRFPSSWDHPRYDEWKAAVANDETLLGLEDWVEHNPEGEE